MKIKKALAVLGAVGAGLPAILRAQSAANIEQFERSQRQSQFPAVRPLDLSTNTEAPELYPGENADVGIQRILRLKPRRTYFEAVADSQFLSTGNAYLSDENKVRATLYVNTIQLAFAPEAYRLGGGQAAPSVGVRSQWFNYNMDERHGNLSRLDFDAQTAFINEKYQIRNWLLFGGFDFTQLLDQSRYDVQYRECVPALGFQRFFPVTENLVFALGGQIEEHITSAPAQSQAPSDVNDRFDCVASVSLSYEIVRRLVLQPYYRFEYTHYRHFSDNTTMALSRVDFVHTVGASLAYYFGRHFAARIFTTYETQYSDYSHAFDYHKVDAGGGLTLDLRF